MAPVFETPEKVLYRCSQCGDCCRAWNVPLGPGEAERIEALDWSTKDEEIADSTPTTPAANAGRRQLARRENGACIFLGHKNQCLIHEHFGEEAKPLLCRMFPFGFYPMAGRTAVDVSFYCRAVSEEHGEPVERRTPEWAKLLGDSMQKAEQKTHRLDEKKSISGELLWEFEFYLIRFLQNTDLSFFDRVRCCLKYMELATTGDPTKPNANVFRQAIADGLPLQSAQFYTDRNMNETQRAMFYQELFLALNPAPANFQTMSPREQAREKERRLSAAYDFRDQRENPWIDNKPLQVSCEQINAVTLGALESEANSFLQKFFTAKIIGQKFRFSGNTETPLTEAVHRLMLLYPFTIWTAKALAANRDAKAVEIGDVRHTVRLLDRILGQALAGQLTPEQKNATRFVLIEANLTATAASDLLAKS